ncbi:MAG: hypothetical protein J6W31_05355, partial [Clostridia bacterium]|nr:hypothetical protein [Clostridia bacterium]
MRFMVLSFLFWHLPFFLFVGDFAGGRADFAGEAPKSVPKTIRFRMSPLNALILFVFLGGLG